MTGVGVLATVELPGVAASVRWAREGVRGLLAGAGVADVDEAVLLLSEVFTNAIRHTASGRPGGRVLVVVADCGDGAVQVEVVDDGSHTSKPHVREEEEGVSGRGLWLVEQVALRWGWWEDGAGRTVWFQVPKRDAPFARTGGEGMKGRPVVSGMTMIVLLGLRRLWVGPVPDDVGPRLGDGTLRGGGGDADRRVSGSCRRAVHETDRTTGQGGRALEDQVDAGELLSQTRKLLSGAGLDCVDVADSGEAAAVVVMRAGRPMAEISTGPRGGLLMVSVPHPGGSPSLQMAGTAEQAAGFVPGYREARGAGGG